MTNVAREKAVMVGNDPDSDIRGAAGAGSGLALVDRRGDPSVPKAIAVLLDLRGLPALVGGG